MLDPSCSPASPFDLFARHVNPTFVKLLGVLGYGRRFVSARGVSLVDDHGRRYLDLLAGYGTVNLGHNHPRLFARLAERLAAEPLGVNHIGPSAAQGELAAALAARLPPPLTMSLFALSGSEAIGEAVKLARAATSRIDILFADGAFHGNTLGALALMGRPRLRRPFEPLLPGCQAVPFGDLPALEKALARRRVAAFVVEPIQCEAGVVIPPAGYLRQAAELCRRHGTLLIADEVQTGLGRTGRFLACEHEGVMPDVLVLGKALGGALTALSVAVTSADIFARAYGAIGRFDLHGTTLAGNALSCAAGLATLEILDDQQLVAASAQRGEQLLCGLRRQLAGHPLVRDIRGRGLLVGIELGASAERLTGKLLAPLRDAVVRQVVGQWLALRLLEQGMVVQPAAHAWNVLRIEPPLCITESEIDAAVAAIAKVLAAYPKLAPLLRDAIARVGSQFLRDWEFCEG